MKKAITLVMVLLIAFGMCVPVYAAETAAPAGVYENINAWRVTKKQYLCETKTTSKKKAVATLHAGAIVTMIDYGKTYSYVEHGNKKGYIRTKYLSKSWGYGSVASITVPGTNIKKQNIGIANDNNFYVKNNINGKSSSSGSLFFDVRNAAGDRQKNIIIYGNAKKKMFKDLSKFMDAEFFATANPITINYKSMFAFDGSSREYAIFAAGTLDAGSDPNFWKTEFKSDAELQAYAKSMWELCAAKETGIAKADFKPSGISQMLTLITSTSSKTPNTKRVVFACR